MPIFSAKTIKIIYISTMILTQGYCMKLSVFCSAVIIASALLMSTAYAEVENKIPAHHSFLSTNNYDAIRATTYDGLLNTSSTPFSPEQILSLEKGFTKGIVSIKTGKITSERLTSWSKYYLNSAITIHQNAVFNLSITASLEQFKNSQLNPPFQSILKQTKQVKASEFNYSYGLMGSYSISSTWYFSGGIIHTSPLNDLHNTSWHTNSNMAIIGTTYSF